jgi:hypothetical protein
MALLADYIDIHSVTTSEYDLAAEYIRSYRAERGTDGEPRELDATELQAMAEYIRSLRRGVFEVAPPTSDSLQREITEALQTAITEPQSAETDGVKITNRSIPDLIEADKYLRSVRSSGFSIKRIIPGGSVRL